MDADGFYVTELGEKYKVIKTEDWAIFQAHLHSQGQFALLEHSNQLEINGEYFVVREQDVFAPAGLYAYASNIRTALEFSEVSGLTLISDETKERLNELADLLVSMAQQWQQRSWFKIPD